MLCKRVSLCIGGSPRADRRQAYLVEMMVVEYDMICYNIFIRRFWMRMAEVAGPGFMS